MQPKYPDVDVKLSGKDGNIFNLIGIAIRAMREAMVPGEDRERFRSEVMAASSYDEALQIIMRYVNVS